MLNILFQIIIYPLYAGLETIFSFFFDFYPQPNSFRFGT